MTFVPITAYRNFYDVPRVFILDWQSGSYFFDCPFDDEMDDHAKFDSTGRAAIDDSVFEIIDWS